MSGAMRWHSQWLLLCLLCLFHLLCSTVAVAQATAQPICASSLEELNKDTYTVSPQHKLLYTSSTSNDGSVDSAESVLFGVHEANGPSACAGPMGCPRAAMVWASGTLTFPGLLTPGSFTPEANLTLRLSLCCDYLFRGDLLHNATLYDDFLRVLLQASPLQVLTREERRAAFPRLRARLLNRHTEGKASSVKVETNGNVQANSTQKTQSEEQAKLEQWMSAAAKRKVQDNNTDNDVSENNDDGDVLVLYTGELPIEAVARLHEVLTPTSTSRPDLLDDSSAGHERIWLDRHMADVQLKITNAVLKCKCPHTLLVMPLLRLQRDELPLVQIRGIGTHCAPRALLTATIAYSNNEDVHGPQLRCIRTPSTSGTSDEADVQYAMRFSLTPPHILPGTRVTWHVTRRQNIKVGAHSKEEDSDVVLHDSRVVQASIDSRHGSGGGLVLSEAASLYFLVTPNTYYDVEVRVSRGPFLTQLQRGEFLLREPFPSAQTSQTPHVVVPHFGFRRYVQLHEETIAQARSHITHINTYNNDDKDGLYRGYWESVPVTRTAMSAQHYLRLRDDAWLHNSSNSVGGVYFTLQPGRNVLQYTVHDMDDVCPATVLETHVVWAIQSVMTHEPIRTACEETLDVGAVSVHALVQTMRNNLHMPLLFSNEGSESGLREGYFHCERHTPHNNPTSNNTVKEEKGVVLQLGKQATEEECVIRGQTIQRDNHEIHAAVQLTKRGVYGLRWVIELYVHNASLVAPANIDPAYAIVTKLHENETQESNNNNTSEKSVWRVLVYSREQILVRRALRRPSGAIHVVLPMHLRRWRIEPPRPSSFHADNNEEDNNYDEDNMRVVGGRWEVQWPLQVYSVDEWASAELNTAAVPNIVQVLPANTLRFVLYDPGQDLSVLYGISYRARCPDQIIPYTIQVIAQPAPQVHPDTETVYTERNCIALRAPRPARKDEHIEWHVLPCSEGRVTRMRLLGVNEYALRRHEQMTRALAEAAGRDIHRINTLEEEQEKESGVGGYDAEDIPTEQRNTNYEDNRGGDMQEGSVMYVCDIAPFEHCAVRWTARNAAGTVTKTFALRRCMQPPRLVYHGSDEHGTMTREERMRVGMLSHVVPRISILETTKAITTTTSSEIVTPGNGEGVVRGRMWHVLPLVGREVTWGYSFDYREGPQTHFEAAFALMPHSAAHQLSITSLLYKEEEGEDVNTHVGRTAEVDELSTQNISQVQTRLLAWRQAALERHLVPLTYTPQNTESADETIVAEYDDYDVTLHRLHLWQPAHVTHSDNALDRAMDAAANAAVRLTHNSVTRRVTMHGLADSALYPMNYTICTATTSQPNATSPEALDAAEFARRGLCRRRTGKLVILSLTPRGVIEPQALRTRNHTQSTTPIGSTSFEAYAPPVLAFCASSYRFSRHPDLYSVYGYDFYWRCDGQGSIRVERRGPTHSTLYHTSESSNHTHEEDASSALATSEEDTLCELTVSNRVTQTTQTEMFALRRVFPTPSESLRFVILSPNTLEATREGLNIIPTPNNDTAEETRKANRPARLRRIIGTSVVLHIDHAKTHGMKYESEQHGKLDGWAVVYVVPATQLASGTQVMSQSVEFTPLPRHPAALARHINNSNDEGVTVLVSGMNIAGLYALQYHLPDPTEPELCPGHRIHETFEVIRARIVTMKELYLCGDETTLQAVPLPRDLQTDFYTRWELYSVQVSPNVTHYYNTDSETNAFAGVRFSQPTSPQTHLSGLGFGIYTVRWAIYKRSANVSEVMTLVDHDTIRVLVLTDNLRSERLVTLGSDMTLQTTSSMSNFTLVKTTSTSSALMHGHWKGTRRPVELSLQHCTGTCLGSGINLTSIHDPTTAAAADVMSPLLTLRHLPLGVTQVRYTLRPSAHVFGAMRGHTCAVSRLIQVERLGAFVHAETSLDHECDAYRGSTRITLCLHTGTTDNTTSNSSSTSQVHFIGLDRFEAIAKRDAAALVNTLHTEGQQQQEEKREDCVLPWWLQSDAMWNDLHYVNNTSIDGGHRCVDFAVRAGHYLSPYTLQQPLFTLQSKGHRSDTKTEELRCTRIAGLLSSRLIEGDGLFVPTHHSNAHSTTSDSDVVGPVTYLPLLDSHTLTPLPHRMRALLGITTTQTVLSELDLAAGNATSVLLRLRLKAANDVTRYAGFIAQEYNNTSGTSTNQKEHASALTSLTSLLMKCVEGSVRGHDVLQYWHSTNNIKGDERRSTRSHEANGDAVGEWVRYVEAMHGVPVRCEVLFHSLDRLLHHVEDNEESGEAARAHATLQAALSSHTTDHHKPRSTNTNVRRKHYTDIHRTSNTEGEAGLVTLEVLERQLHSLQENMQWTRDHIDVTRLTPELQQALSRRRITRRQLEVLQATRQRRRGSDNDGIDTHIVKEKQSEQQHHTDMLPITSSTSLSVTTNEASQAARIRHILQMYHSLTGEESVAVRLTLPGSEAFAVDRNVSVRTALHKDIICGTSRIDSVHSDTSEEGEDNNALVEFGSVSIADSEPSVQLNPWQVKQCEVEAGLPLLRLHMSGSRFALLHNFQYDKQEEEENVEEVMWHRVDARDVELEEVIPVHTNTSTSISSAYIVRGEGGDSESEIGLRPCFAAMRAGMQVALSGRTYKELYLRLGACPHFAMLASAEYNENQNSTLLLQRLHTPRYLRATIHRALATQPTHSESHTENGTAELRANGDVRVVLQVRPTLARLHMRTAQPTSVEQHTLPLSSHTSSSDVFQATRQRRPLLLCERDMRRTGLQLGIELVGDRWTDPVGQSGAVYATTSNTNDTTGEARRKSVRSPQDVALLNSFSVVEHHSLESMPQLYLRGGGVYRSHFVNYLFTVLLAEPTVHAGHTFVRRYNDSFIALVLPPDPQGVPHDSLSFTQRGASSSDLVDVRDMLRAWLDDGDAQRSPLSHTSRTQALPYTTTTTDSERSGYEVYQYSESDAGEVPALPAVRRFSKVEEILFAVPGFATECRGCLLADTTFFVAGDFTGVWRIIITTSNTILSAYPTRQELLGPLTLPWYTPQVIPRVWHYVWACPRAAEHALWDLINSDWFRLAASSVRVPYVELRVMLYTEHTESGQIRYGDARLQTLLTSEPLPITELIRSAARTHAYTSRNTDSDSDDNDMRQQWPVVFTVSEAAAARAHATLSSDLQRYKHGQRSSAMFRYHDYHFADEDEQAKRGAGLLHAMGAGRRHNGLVVNASVYLRLCVPLAANDNDMGATTEEYIDDVDGKRKVRPVVHAMCSTVSITDALLAVEAPRHKQQQSSLSQQSHAKVHVWQRMWRRMRGKDTEQKRNTSESHSALRWPVYFVHHAFLATLLFSVLPETGLLCRGSMRAATAEERHLARYIVSAVTFVALGLLALCLPPLWSLAWLLLWCVFMYFSTRPGAGLLFLASTVIWRCVA